MTVGSRSTKIARGTCFPAPVSLKKVLKASSPPPTVLSPGIWPSGCKTNRIKLLTKTHSHTNYLGKKTEGKSDSFYNYR